jgi:hypothetical protein
MTHTSPILVSTKLPYAPPTLVDYGSVTALTQALPAMGLIVLGGLVTATVSVTAVVL